MKKFIVYLTGLSLLLMVCQQAFAQNYRPFRKGYIYSYVANDSVYTMRIDTAKVVNGDSVFVFNKTVKKGMIRTGFANCIGTSSTYHVQPNNQFGYWMKKSPNGVYIFRSAQGKEFLLKTQVAVNTSWSFNSSLNLTAALVSDAMETFSGVTDYVKTYSLSNGAQIKLSQNYGFVKAPNFMAYVPNSDFKKRTLLLNKLPEKITTIWNWNYEPPIFKIYDFQPGDKFSFKTDTTQLYFKTLYSWDQYEVLSRRKSLGDDSIIYKLLHSQLSQEHNIFTGTTSVPVLSAPKIETFAVSLYDDFTEGDLLTNEYIEGGATFHNRGTVQTKVSRTSKYNQHERSFFNIYEFDSQCSSFWYTPDIEHSFELTPGLGKTYEYTYDQSYFSHKELQAYIKGTETYGTWLSLTQIMNNITGTEEAKEPIPFSTFPNPFANELSLKFSDTFKSGNATVLISNTLGQEVYKQELAAAPNQETKLQLPEMAKGVYVLQVTENDKTYTCRLVKE